MAAPLRRGRKSVTFRSRAEPGSKVYLVGTFNAWNTKKHSLRFHPREGAFRITLVLPLGRYEYRLLVNDRWELDPACPDTTPNPFGGLNNVIIVTE